MKYLAYLPSLCSGATPSGVKKIEVGGRTISEVAAKIVAIWIPHRISTVSHLQDGLIQAREVADRSLEPYIRRIIISPWPNGRKSRETNRTPSYQAVFGGGHYEGFRDGDWRDGCEIFVKGMGSGKILVEYGELVYSGSWGSECRWVMKSLDPITP